MPGKIKLILGCAISLLLILFFISSIHTIWNSPRSMQWDFMVYYYAGEAYNQGLNPYLLESLSTVSGENSWLYYAYPPVTLQVFRLLPVIDFESGHKIWLILKAITLCFLIYLWRKYFVGDISLLIIIPFVLLSFDSTVFWDIKSGNISIFEQLILWLAFWAFLKEKPVLFIALVLAGSIFKFFPGLFICLLLVSEIENKVRWFGVGVALLALLVLSNYFINPELFESFMTNMRAIDERANDFNYGMLAFWDDIYLSNDVTANLGIRNYLVYGSYIITAGSVLVISVANLFRLHKGEQLNQKVHTILFFCCMYALIVPRFKCYSFILLIPAFLYLLRSFRQDHFIYILMILGMIPVATPFFEADLISRFFRYYPLFLAGILWGCYIIKSFEQDSQNNTTLSASTG